MRRLLVVAVVALLAGCATPTPGSTPIDYHREVLAASPFTDLVIEIDHAPGRAPSEEAKTHLLATFRNITTKQRVSLIVQATLPDTPNKRWTGDELVALERETRTTPHAPPTAILRVLYPAGEFEREGVAGVTIGGTILGPAVVFLDTLRNIDTNLRPLPLPAVAVTRLERATLLHEAGHAIGLVNNGLPMTRDHEDAEHEGHSRNPASVMYWRVETTNGLRDYILNDQSVPDTFDDDDRADIRAGGGR